MQIDAGEGLLEEGDGSSSDIPLVKDLYGSERRKAKVCLTNLVHVTLLLNSCVAPGVCQVLNFSIAYGKTAMGLSKDWGVTVQEAKETLERWYSDRPEVRSLDSRSPAFRNSGERRGTSR